MAENINGPREQRPSVTRRTHEDSPYANDRTMAEGSVTNQMGVLRKHRGQMR